MRHAMPGNHALAGGRTMHALASYLALYIALYAGWGVMSPFLPAVLADRGAGPEEIGTLLAAAIAVKLVATPAIGALTDRLGAPRQVLAVLLLAAGVLGLGYGVAASFAALLLISLAHAAATGPLGPLPDAMAIHAATSPGPAAPGAKRPRGARFDYGIVRGAGAAAFVAGTALAGPAVAAAGSPAVVLWLNAGLFALTAGAALLLPPPRSVLGVMSPHQAEPPPRATGGAAPGGGARRLFAIPVFRRLFLVSALISGSHAFYVAFATLRWQAAGLAPETIGLLWSVSVAAEVGVFFLLGRPLLARLGPGRLCALAAAGGALRWSVMAVTAWAPAMFLVQPLHGLTFAAQHLAAMAVLARMVPERLAATALSLYASLGTGLANATLTFASGPLYAQLGAGGFWVMALLCAAAVPVALTLRVEGAAPAEGGGWVGSR